jgi:hypothetical protein
MPNHKQQNLYIDNFFYLCANFFKPMKRGYSYIFILLLLFIAVSCGNNSDKISATDLVNNPNTASGNVNSDELPAFSFQDDLYNFGRIGQGEVVTHIFKFTNSGKTDLIISAAKASCGCTVADYPKNPIKPGGAGEIPVKFDSEGKKGLVTKTVTLTANTQPNTKVLTIKAEVILPEQQ